jgi:hypothetical protein
MEALAKTIGGVAKVKLLRLFAFHPDSFYEKEQLAKKTKLARPLLTKELAVLTRAGVLERKECTAPGVNGKKKKVSVWGWNKQYSHADALTVFLHDTLAIADKDIKECVRPAGKPQMLVVGGFFTGNTESELDMLLVGDKMDVDVLDASIAKLEAEYGKEIQYAILTPEEYQFRIRVRDKLIRDLMDFPHRKVVDMVQL